MPVAGSVQRTTWAPALADQHKAMPSARAVALFWIQRVAGMAGDGAGAG